MISTLSFGAKRERLKRASKPKVRTGCITCKSRRLKCDEAKPSCQRCVTAGKTCEGYVPPPKPWIFETNSEREERQSFQHYSDKLPKYLAGYYDAPFWQNLVANATNAHPAIKHILVAISALHEIIESAPDGSIFRQGNDPRHIFALKQQNKAIEALTSSNNSPQIETMLLSCLLFLCFETLQGNYLPAYHHLRSGMKIIGDRRDIDTASNSPDPDSPEGIVFDEVSHILSGLAVQAAMMGDVGTSQSLEEHAFGHSALQFPIKSMLPSHFDDILEAREGLETLIRFFSQYADSVRHFGHEKPFISSVKQQLSSWQEMFKTLISTIPRASNSEIILSVTCLQVNHIVAEIMIDAFSSDDEMIYDQFISQFTELINLAERHTTYSDKLSSQNSFYTFEIGILGALFFTATHCRDPYLRRKATGLLLKRQNKQGIWDTQSAAIVAEKIIEVEEQDTEVQTCTDVLQEHRVRKLCPLYDPMNQYPLLSEGQGLRLSLTRYPYEEWMNVVLEEEQMSSGRSASLTSDETTPSAFEG